MSGDVGGPPFALTLTIAEVVFTTGGLCRDHLLVIAAPRTGDRHSILLVEFRRVRTVVCSLAFQVTELVLKLFDSPSWTREFSITPRALRGDLTVIRVVFTRSILGLPVRFTRIATESDLVDL